MRFPWRIFTAQPGGDELSREGDSVESITNEPDMEEAQNDETLKSSVEQALSEEIGDDLGIEVGVHDSIVTLAGSVDSPEVRALAEDTVKSLPGVISVINKVDLVPPAEINASRIVNDR